MEWLCGPEAWAVKGFPVTTVEPQPVFPRGFPYEQGILSSDERWDRGVATTPCISLLQESRPIELTE
jgi:hypothetical protein